MAQRARVEADVVQRLRHAVPADEHVGAEHAGAPRRVRAGAAEKEVAPAIPLRPESGKEGKVRQRGGPGGGALRTRGGGPGVKPSVGKKEGIFGKKEILGERRSNAAEAPGRAVRPGCLPPGHDARDNARCGTHT